MPWWVDLLQDVSLIHLNANLNLKTSGRRTSLRLSMQVNSPNTVGSVDYSCGYQLAKTLVLREVLKVVVALSPKVCSRLRQCCWIPLPGGSGGNIVIKHTFACGFGAKNEDRRGTRNEDRRSTKKNLRKGTLNEKNSCTPINPKKYSCYGLKKKLYKEFDNEKKFLLLKNSPPPPHNFSNRPSLIPLLWF